MIKASYEQLVERISRLSTIPKEDIERRIDAKRAKLSGLVSKEGAAQIVAVELGINFESQRMKISELLMGMYKANVLGKILKIEPVRSFKKNNYEGKVAVLRIADDTGSIRAVLWDTNHISLIEQGKLKENDVIEISAASVRGEGEKELHLGSHSKLEISDIKIDISENILAESRKIAVEGPEKHIAEINPNERARINATLVQIFEPRFFSTCPECNKKIQQEGDHFYCQTHGNVIPNYKAILVAVFDDGTDSMRTILFDDAISKFLELGKDEFSKLKDSEFLMQKKASMLGKNYSIFGKARMNSFFNDRELIANDLQEANPDDLIKQLSPP